MKYAFALYVAFVIEQKHLRGFLFKYFCEIYECIYSLLAIGICIFDLKAEKSI